MSQLQEIMKSAQSLSLDELRQLNGAVVGLIKAQRNAQAAVKRVMLREGDRVTWNGRHGRKNGVITRVKRKKAFVTALDGSRWDVPLAMLEPSRETGLAACKIVGPAATAIITGL
jgi:hypothetical protein